MGKIRIIQNGRPEEVGPTPEAFLREVGSPFLLRVAGRDRSRSRAVCTLLHGNEPSGIRAVHAWLRADPAPAVDVVVLIGAVEAALLPPGFAHRALPGEPDLNRCFVSPFKGIAGEALRLLRDARPEALIDIHNTTGHTPSYGVGTALGAAQLNLVSLFARLYVHSDLRLGTLVEAVRDDFPSVVIECGRAGDPAADAVARAGLERYLKAERLETRVTKATDMRVVGRPIRVSLRPGARLAFGLKPVEGVDLTVRRDIDGHNFQSVRAGDPIGWMSPGGEWPLWAVGASGEDVSRELFEVRDGVLEARREMTPIMMTADPAIAVSDCLFYVVHPAGPAEG